MMGFLLGYDIGSSFVKASLLDIDSGEVVASSQSPNSEMPIHSPQPGWAEQNPSQWWDALVQTTRSISEMKKKEISGIKAIGISYQMHGLVLLDSSFKILRPAIIWCDGRAVKIGSQAAEDLGRQNCLEHFCNLPGNFTASRMRWVKENEPEIFKKTSCMLLPGDFILCKLTGECSTTFSGLSEAILWDYSKNSSADILLDYYQIPEKIIPPVFPNIGHQGKVSAIAAEELGIPEGTPVTYRSGDQPNNALSLNVMDPGVCAMTAGTSGVVYGISDRKVYDNRSRVNIFTHVNNSPEKTRLGILLCVSGSGCSNSWLRRLFSDSQTAPIPYSHIDSISEKIPAGSEGLCFIPYGNGPERTLENIDIGASFFGLHFNRHSRAHLARACQEGVAFALNYGIETMRSFGIDVSKCRAGYANMFKSKLFTEALAAVTKTTIELFDTDGSQGAARGAGLGAGIFTESEAYHGLKPLNTVSPDSATCNKYNEIYVKWKKQLETCLKGVSND